MSVSVDLAELYRELSGVDCANTNDSTETTIITIDWLKERIAELEAMNAALRSSPAVLREVHATGL
jgi:hypothetical protein